MPDIVPQVDASRQRNQAEMAPDRADDLSRVFYREFTAARVMANLPMSSNGPANVVPHPNATPGASASTASERRGPLPRHFGADGAARMSLPFRSPWQCPDAPAENSPASSYFTRIVRLKAFLMRPQTDFFLGRSAHGVSSTGTPQCGQVRRDGRPTKCTS